MTRPAAAAGTLDAVRQAVPERIRKRLDAGNPAEGWVWTPGDAATTVATDNGETVTVTHREGGVTAADLRCSCLLSPKCLHVLAVAAALAGDTKAADAPAGPPPVVERPAPPPSPPAALDAGQRSAVAAAVRASRAVLEAGAGGVGATAVDDLRRAIHACRATSLHRPARAGQRVLSSIDELRKGKPQFSLSALTESLRELAWTAEVLHRGLGRESDVGIGRRTYESVGTLRLHGVACEPVASATGHGGISTLLVDGQGVLYTVSDVRPGGAGRAKASYEAAAQIGGATLPHRELARHGLFVQNATRSPDGRLGMGEGVRAVRASRGSFDDEPVARRFAESAARQIANPEPLGWLFLTITVHGAHGPALIASVDGLQAPVRLVAPTDHQEFAYVDNLRFLARAPGLRLRIVARPAGPRRTLAVVAASPFAGDPRVKLPEEWAGRLSLGYDLLRGAHAEDLLPRPLALELADDEDLDPIAPLRRRVERAALGGKGTLPAAAFASIERERAAMATLHLHGGAELAGALFRAARAPNPDAWWVEWLRAATWADTVRERMATADLSA